MPASDPDDLPPITFTEAGVCHFANLRNVSVGVWVGRATLAAARGLFSVGGQMGRRFPRGHSSITFVLDGVPAPAPEVGELLARSFGRGSDLACMAVIVEGSGFWASALRDLLANMHRSGRSPARLQVATGLGDVLGWFSDEHALRTGVRFERALLRDALLRMRHEAVALALPPPV